MTTRQLKLIEIMNKIDDELGIGLGLKVDESTNVDHYIAAFINKFTVKYDFNDLLNYMNESEDINKSLMEELREI